MRHLGVIGEKFDAGKERSTIVAGARDDEKRRAALQGQLVADVGRYGRACRYDTVMVRLR